MGSQPWWTPQTIKHLRRQADLGQDLRRLAELKHCWSWVELRHLGGWAGHLSRRWSTLGKWQSSDTSEHGWSTPGEGQSRVVISGDRWSSNTSAVEWSSNPSGNAQETSGDRWSSDTSGCSQGTFGDQGGLVETSGDSLAAAWTPVARLESSGTSKLEVATACSGWGASGGACVCS